MEHTLGTLLKDSIFTLHLTLLRLTSLPPITPMHDRISDQYMKSAGEDTMPMELEERVQEQARELDVISSVMDQIVKIGRAHV